MSTPPTVGMFRTEDHRYYWNGEGPYPSVTTAISMYDKSDALVGWAKKETSSFAIRHLDELIAHRAHNTPDPDICGPCADNAKRRKPVDRTEAARLWVSSISDYQRDAAADLGTRVHELAEAVARGETPDDATDLIPYGVQYQRFREERQPEYLAIEYMGINEAHEYAGTGDIIARLDDEDWCIDIKTFTKPGPVPAKYYPTTGMQLVACSRFDFIGKEGDPTRYVVPKVDRYGVLLIGQEDYRLIPYRVTGATFDAFLNCLSLLRWSRGEAQAIVGAA